MAYLSGSRLSHAQQHAPSGELTPPAGRARRLYRPRSHPVHGPPPAQHTFLRKEPSGPPGFLAVGQRREHATRCRVLKDLQSRTGWLRLGSVAAAVVRTLSHQSISIPPKHLYAIGNRSPRARRARPQLKLVGKSREASKGRQRISRWLATSSFWMTGLPSRVPRQRRLTRNGGAGLLAGRAKRRMSVPVALSVIGPSGFGGRGQR